MARFQVTLSLPGGKEHVIEVAPEQHVLEVALEAGMELPYSCLQGWCLTCAARLVRGEVDQSHSRRYYAADRSAGFILPCTARPRSNLLLETHACDAMRRARRQHGLPFPQGDWGARHA